MSKKRISSGNLELEIDTLGARIVKFTSGGKEIMKTAKDVLQGYNGMVLAPWPNRIPEGKYSLGGTEYQLQVNEIDRDNALHGFAFKTEFEIKALEQNQITLAARLDNPAGYPFEIHLEITYKLENSGLSCEVRATNKSDSEAPFGIAFHPYYPVSDEAKISIPAKTHIMTNSQMIPIAEQPNPHKSFVFGEVDFDDCFTELERRNGIAKIYISETNSEITLWQDQAFDFVMVYTTDEFDAAKGTSQAIAIEAQSCIANAFSVNPPLLAPGGVFAGRWGVEISE